MVAVNSAASVTEDWNVPHKSADVTQWQRLGYSTANMLLAGQTIINAAMAAFPTQQITMAIAGNGNVLDGGDDVCCGTIGDWARASWPGRFTVQKRSLRVHP